MAALYRSVKQFGKSLILPESNRSVSLSATAHLIESEFAVKQPLNRAGNALN